MNFTIDEFEEVQELHSLVPISALITYKNPNDGRHATFMAEHDFTKVNNEFVIGEAHLLTLKDQTKIANKLLNKTNSTMLIHENMLAAFSDGLAWFIPAKTWSMSTLIMGKIKRFNIPMPPHVAVCKNNKIFVYAIKENKRPTLDTELFRSPVPNVYSKGNLCKGSVKFPSSPSSKDIPEIEKGIFETVGSDLHVQSLKDINPEDHIKSLISLKDTDYFNVSTLVSFPNKHTLKSALGV